MVPESIVRFGTRVAGRDGVQTLKAQDDQIKWVAFLTALGHWLTTFDRPF